MSVRGFRRLSAGVLLYNLMVIAWGAYVRASGSGAGCGRHWPLCNGEVIPRTARVATLIEFTHRATSGGALISVALLAIGAFLAFESGHVVRKGAVAAVLFMVTEAAIGAGLVLLRLVEHDESITRAIFMAMHLTNTFFLLASLSLTLAWSWGVPSPRLRQQGITGALLAFAIGGLVLLGISGAITALGDTLFPATSLAQGMESDFSPTANLFIRLRIWHPVIAIMMGGYVTLAAMLIAAMRPSRLVRRTAGVLLGLFVAQLALGALNVALLAPIGIQLAHLLMADCVWISLVTLSASALSREVEAAPESSTGTVTAPVH